MKQISMMNHLFICLVVFYCIQQFSVNGDTCLHNERSKCTQVRHIHEITPTENEHCHHLCIRTGHATGHCSLSSNCFQYCLCIEKDL